MSPIGIILIIFCVAVVGGVLGNYIYKKIKKIPTGECASCKLRMENTINQIRKQLAKDRK